MITIEEINSNDERIVEEKVIKYRQKLQQRNIDLIATRKQNRQAEAGVKLQNIAINKWKAKL